MCTDANPNMHPHHSGSRLTISKRDLSNYLVREALFGSDQASVGYKSKCSLCVHIPLHKDETHGDVHELELGYWWWLDGISWVNSFRESGITEFVKSSRSLVSVMMHKEFYRVRIYAN